MSFLNDVKKLIDRNLKTYRDDPDRFIADYNRELELTNEYNGRQLLELLQNADDAGSKKVLIQWDKTQCTLTISNKGKPFETGGIKSLMLANLSPKTKKSYIGNKGLGFRSILNWAEIVHVQSNGCVVTFSSAIANDVFENQLNLSSEQKQQIRNDRNFTARTIPFPILAIPLAKESTTASEWTTSIEIRYRKVFEEDIVTQLDELKEEILLFLNNIECITVHKQSDIKELISEKSDDAGYDTISIKDKTWRVFKREDVLPETYQDERNKELQSYSLKVAIQDDLSDNYNKLFCFFPTQLTVSLPCIIHGTFELNSSRNQLNESEKNKYILEELVHLVKDCALYLTKERIDWRPYKLLTPFLPMSDSKLIETFYQKLEQQKKEACVYPCINQQYNKISNAVYYTDEFNGFFQKHFPHVLPELLLPLDGKVKNEFEEDIYDHKHLVEKIDAISATNILPQLRSELIAQLCDVIEFDDDSERFSLLTNESGTVISKDEIAFTPLIRADERFNIPRSVKVDFMGSELYDLLNARFEAGYDKKELRSRELQRIIKSVVNLQPYDSKNVIEKIISGTKEEIKNLPSLDAQRVCVKEMVAALFSNFITIESRQDKLKLAIPLISKSKHITEAENLFLSNTYPSGYITDLIYGEELSPDEYLVDVDYWSLGDVNITLLEDFFLWVGVNKFSKIKHVPLKDNYAQQPFFDFLFEHGTEHSPDFTIGRIIKESHVTSIVNFAQIKKLTLNRIILLALKDAVVRRNLEQNEEIVQWQYNYWRTLSSSYSYIRYQFVSSGLFTKCFLEDVSDELFPIINRNINIDYTFFEALGIDRAEVRSILIKLGAKESFNEMAPEDIYDILSQLPTVDGQKNGRSTQVIYKMALDSLVKQNSTVTVPGELMLFCRIRGNGDYLPSSSIYYSDNSILPKKILNGLPMLNMPKRVGEDNVEKYFGVKSLRDFRVEIDENTLKPNYAHGDLEKLFERLKPYLLAYRLDSPNLRRKVIDNETKRREARVLKNCKINLVNQCYFSFGDDEDIPIEKNEFINIKDTFFYRDEQTTSIEQLKKNSLFCDAFAEMMCIIFKVNDLKNDFRQIFKNDFPDMVHLAIQDLGQIKIEEAFNLLGLSKAEIDFWNNVFTLQGSGGIDPSESNEILYLKVKNDLGIDLPVGYVSVDFESFGNLESFQLVEMLCGKQGLGLPLQEVVPGGLAHWHRHQISNSLKDFDLVFRTLIWARLADHPSEQKSFIAILNRYRLDYLIELECAIQEIVFELQPNYAELTRGKILNDFQVDCNNSLSEHIEIRNLYDTLLSQHAIEEVDLPEGIRSLLFFEGHESEIGLFIKANFESINDQPDNSANDELTIATIVETSLSCSNATPRPHEPENGSWVHSSSVENKKKKRGKNAELLAYNTLVNRYGNANVKWVSGNSTTPDKNDRLHYDIEYKNEHGIWKYVEVKSISDNQFIMSSPEKNKGLSDPKNYEMALVFDNTIYMIKDIFKFGTGESFENNSKFTAHPKDYFFTFNIDALVG